MATSFNHQLSTNSSKETLNQSTVILIEVRQIQIKVKLMNRAPNLFLQDTHKTIHLHLNGANSQLAVTKIVYHKI